MQLDLLISVPVSVFVMLLFQLPLAVLLLVVVGLILFAVVTFRFLYYNHLKPNQDPVSQGPKNDCYV